MHGRGQFSDGTSASAAAVRVTTTPRGLVIEDHAAGAPALVWPYGALATSVPLSKTTTDIVVTYRYAPGASLYLSDPRLIGELALEARHLTTGGQRMRWAIPLMTISIVAALIAAGIWAMNLSPARAIAGMIPHETRAALGQQVVKSMTSTRKTCTAPAGNAALSRMVERLTQAAGDARFKVRVIDWGLVNAFAAPGGQIVVTRGLIAKARSPDEVAGVIAHEMGHGLKLHPESGLVRALGLSAALELVTGGAGGTIANIGLMLTQLSYSRDAEREADTVAIDLMRKSGISAKGLVDFFETIEQAGGGKANGSSGRAGETPSPRRGTDFSVLASHPVTTERLARARAVPAYPSTPALDARDWDALRTVCAVTTP